MSRCRFRAAVGAFCFALLSACGTPEKEPTPANDVTDFATLYGENCSGCHGQDGKNSAAQPLNDSEYLAFIPKAKLQEVIESGISGYSMPAFAHAQGGPLYPKQISALVNGIEHWSKTSGFADASMPGYSGNGSAPDTAHGQQVFQSDCAGCHAEGKKGGSISNASYLGLVSNQNLRTATVVGRPALGMPDWRSVSARGPLSEADVTDVVAYMASSRPRNGGPAATFGPGQGGDTSQGSGNGPGSPEQTSVSGNVAAGSSSQSGGVGASATNDGAKKHQ